jgi:hypothetical protein
MRVLVGLLQPSMVPLFDQIFTRTVEITMEWPEFSAHWASNIYIYTIL